MRPCLGDHLAHLRERPDAAAPGVVRVLEAEHLRRGHVQVGGRVDEIADLFRAEAPVLGADGLHDQAGVHGRPAQLVAEDVRQLLGHDFVSGLREDAEGDLVRHRGRRDEHGFLLAEQRGAPFFERDHGRVLALLLVPDDGLGDGPAHGLCRLREGVRAEVDHALTVPGREARRRRSERLPSTMNASADTTIADAPATVNASAVPPVAASQPASIPPAGPAPLNAK